MKPLGGTELLKNKLISLLEPNLLDKINLITTTCSFDLLSKDKINVLWQHLGPKQPAVQYMGDRMFVDSVDYFVYVSHWQYNQYRNYFNIPDWKSTVIKNAIDPIEFIPRKNDKIKLMYTSVPWRGLNILIRVIDILNAERDDFELHVYSSTDIYGDDFKKETNGQFDELFERCKDTKNVLFKGYASNDIIRQELTTADILTYPCIEEETSCLSVMEALMAGCHVLTTNYGGLPETCSEFATYVEIDSSGYNLINKYAKELNVLIDKAKSGSLGNNKQLQCDFYKQYYSWDTRITQWQSFLNKLRQY
jgi:glycosyltransferase involved in cell wall biosynthesis